MIVIYDKNNKQYLRTIGGCELAPIAYQSDIDNLSDNEGYLPLHNVNDVDKVNKVIDNYPFDLVFDGENAVDIVFYDKPVIPPTEKQINDMVVIKIREAYSIDDEFKMHRLGTQDVNNTEYQSYLTYVQSCLDWGDTEKQTYGYI